LQLAQTYSDPLEGLKHLRKDPDIELLWLDVEMPGLTGLQLLSTLEDPPMTVLTTANPEYALKAYELDVIGYLVKPFTYADFYKFVRKALDRKETLLDNAPLPRKAFFYLKVDNKLQRIDPEEVLYVEAANNYVIVRMSNGQKHLSLVTMKRILEKLPKYFLRIHRSHIINLEKIEYIEDNFVHIAGKALNISTRYRPLLLKSLDIL